MSKTCTLLQCFYCDIGQIARRSMNSCVEANPTMIYWFVNCESVIYYEFWSLHHWMMHLIIIFCDSCSTDSLSVIILHYHTYETKTLNTVSSINPFRCWSKPFLRLCGMNDWTNIGGGWQTRSTCLAHPPCSNRRPPSLLTPLHQIHDDLGCPLPGCQRPRSWHRPAVREFPKEFSEPILTSRWEMATRVSRVRFHHKA